MGGGGCCLVSHSPLPPPDYPAARQEWIHRGGDGKAAEPPITAAALKRLERALRPPQPRSCSRVRGEAGRGADEVPAAETAATPSSIFSDNSADDESDSEEDYEGEMGSSAGAGDQLQRGASSSSEDNEEYESAAGTGVCGVVVTAELPYGGDMQAAVRCGHRGRMHDSVERSQQAGTFLSTGGGWPGGQGARPRRHTKAYGGTSGWRGARAGCGARPSHGPLSWAYLS